MITLSKRTPEALAKEDVSRITLTINLLVELAQHAEEYAGKTVIVPLSFLSKHRYATNVNKITLQLMACNQRHKISYIICADDVNDLDTRMRTLVKEWKIPSDIEALTLVEEQ